jgi:hypothetical protein
MFCPIAGEQVQYHLAHCAIHTVACGMLGLVLVFLLQALVGMRLLYACCTPWLERCKIDRICLHEHLCNCADIRDEAIDHIER